jgi:hypothetical protein
MTPETVMRLFALLALSPSFLFAAPLLFDDGGIHFIDYVTSDVRVENGSTVIIVAGGEVAHIRTVGESFSFVEVHGGTVLGEAWVHDFLMTSGTVAGGVSSAGRSGGRITIAGGTAGGLDIWGSRSVISGGTIGSVHMEVGGATLLITGGTITSNISAIAGTIDITGGEIRGDVRGVIDAGAITIRGGTYSIGTEFIRAHDSASMTFVGSLLLSTPVAIGDLVWEAFITGTLADGNVLDHRVVCYTEPCATIQLVSVPTPHPVFLMGIGLVALVWLRLNLRGRGPA